MTKKSIVNVRHLLPGCRISFYLCRPGHVVRSISVLELPSVQDGVCVCNERYSHRVTGSVRKGLDILPHSILLSSKLSEQVFWKRPHLHFFLFFFFPFCANRMSNDRRTLCVKTPSLACSVTAETHVIF